MNKKTVGIVTLIDYTNYGNRLQNYAMTRLLESENIQVINGIKVFLKEDWEKSSRNKIKYFIKRCVPFAKFKKNVTVEHIPKSEGLRERRAKFLKFTSEYTNMVDTVVARNKHHALKVLDKYGIEYYVAGSDQVWNPYYAGKDYEFLTFAPKEKRLSFAASMGVDDILESEKERYKENIMDMHYISVREQRAADIIRKLTGRQADVTLDPTLLISKMEWEQVVRKPKINLEEKYICTYFLGETPKAVEQFAKEKQLKIYALNSENDLELYTIDPAEFLYVIKNAAYVLTDSFHAVAFSIKFNKEFYVFRRKEVGCANMFSRIETITKRFELENRIQDSEKIIEQDKITNWDKIEEELKKERKSSVRKLCKMMEN